MASSRRIGRWTWRRSPSEQAHYPGQTKKTEIPLPSVTIPPVCMNNVFVFSKSVGKRVVCGETDGHHTHGKFASVSGNRHPNHGLGVV